MTRPYSFLALILSIIFTIGVTASLNAKTVIYVFAAASTRNAVDAVIGAFPKQPDTRVSAVYGATSALARQILDGAPASLFLSANKDWMNEITKAGLVGKSQKVFSNKLVLISSNHRLKTLNIQSPSDIVKSLKNERLAVAEISAVPAGIYSHQALNYLGIWEKVRPRLAQSANVRAALALVERGETPLGVVYQTDALASPYVEVVWKIPQKSYEEIVYPLAILKKYSKSHVQNSLYSFFFSNMAQRIFTEFGFGVD